METILFQDNLINYDKVTNFYLQEDCGKTSYEIKQNIVFVFGNNSSAYIQYKDYETAKKNYAYLQNAILFLQGIDSFEDDFDEDENVQVTDDGGWVIDMREISSLISSNKDLAMTKEDLLEEQELLRLKISELKYETKQLMKELKEAEAMNGLTISEASEKEGLLSMARKIKKKKKKSLDGYQPEYDFVDEFPPLDKFGVSSHEVELVTHNFEKKIEKNKKDFI